jgi:hypothetical protein
MPFPAIGAAIATAASSAVTAIGSIGLAGLANGAMIVGTGLSIVGEMTGNKTLSKIGMGLGLAGGIGSIANSMRGSSALLSGEKGLLAADGVESALAAPTKGVGSSKFGSELWPSSTSTSTAINGATFNKASASIDGMSPTGAFDPQLEKTYFQRANDTLTKYNTALNVAGGMGQAYMQGQQMELQKDLLDKRLNFDQQLVDRVNTNNGTVLTGINPSISSANTARNPNAYAGILRTR